MAFESPYHYYFQDYYFNPNDPLGEGEMLMQALDIGPGLWQLPQNEPCKICEIGFGFGRNFLVFLKYFAQNINHYPRGVDYIGIEPYPRHYGEFLTIWHDLLPLSPNCQTLCDYWEDYSPKGLSPSDPVRGHRRLWHFMGGRVRLHLVGQGAGDALADVMVVGKIHGFIMNGFRPDKNPEAWGDDIFAKISALSQKNTRLVAHISNEQIKNSMANNGFEVIELPVFDGQQPILGVCHTPREILHNYQYSLNNIEPCPPMPVHILGANVSGLAVANALKLRNLPFEISKNDGFLADSPPLAVLHPHHSMGHDHFGMFSETAYHYAHNFWKNSKFFNQRNHVLMDINPRTIGFLTNAGMQCSPITNGCIIHNSGYVRLEDYCYKYQTEWGVEHGDTPKPAHIPIFANGRGALGFFDFPHSKTPVILREYEDLTEKLVLPQGIVSTKDFYALSADNHWWIGNMVEKPSPITSEVLYSFRGVRFKSADSNPVVGAIYNPQAFQQIYHDYRHGRQYKIYTNPPIMGYIMSAMGGKGLSYTPLAGEILASMVGNGVLPIGKNSYQAINPMRFIIRSLYNV